MKKLIRYIYASEVNIDTSLFNGTPFKCDTGTSYYNDFLNTEELAYKQKAKNRDGKIVLMTPNEYFSECSKHGFDEFVSVENLMEQRRYDKELNNQYMADMEKGDKFPVCYINYADNCQEGLHRMIAAGDLYGWDTKFPVLIVTAFDEEREARWKLIDKVNNFRRWKFKDICKEAVDTLADWQSPPPPDFLDLFKNEIISIAKQQGYDIDIELDQEELDGYHRVNVYLTRFGDYIDEHRMEPVEFWLENLFDMDAQSSELSLDDLDDLLLI